MRVLLVLLAFFTCSQLVAATKIETAPLSLSSLHHPTEKSVTQFVRTTKNKAITKMIGRKLTFKEKLALQLLRWRIVNYGPDPHATKSKKGETAKILGIVSLAALFFFPLATLVCGILAITMGTAAKKLNPHDRDAQTGIVLGIIGVGVFVLLILLIVAIIAAWTGGW